jgi:hypothetical protein
MGLARFPGGDDVAPRLDPYVPQRRLWLSPVLLDAITSLRVERIPLLGGTVTVSAAGLARGPLAAILHQVRRNSG